MHGERFDAVLFSMGMSGCTSLRLGISAASSLVGSNVLWLACVTKRHGSEHSYWIAMIRSYSAQENPKRLRLLAFVICWCSPSIIPIESPKSGITTASSRRDFECMLSHYYPILEALETVK